MEFYTLFRKSMAMNRVSVLLAILFGLASAGIYFLDLHIPVGGGLLLEPSEIFVTLGSALCGPTGGLIIGFLQGIVYAPERNIPAHMFAAFLWGLWYAFFWNWSLKMPYPKISRVIVWTLTVPLYYYVLLLPLHVFIYASYTLDAPFLSTYLVVASEVVPEMIGTIIATDIILIILLERYSAPVNLHD